MAESQVPWTYDGIGQNLITNLSDTRFEPYLVSAGRNLDYAFGLYLYNARLAKAFLYPLHILEVTLRNRISNVFCQYFDTDEWCHSITFREILTQQSLAALDKGIQRAKSRNTADIVATLTFDFWSNLFRAEYDRSLWQTRMQELLPHKFKTRKEFQKAVKMLNDFRNRIAHHEPIYQLNLSQVYRDLLDMLSWLSQDTYRWVKHFSTVNQCMRTKPSPEGSIMPYLTDKSDDDFQTVNIKNVLSDIPTRRFIVCHNDASEIQAVTELHHLAEYFISLREGTDILIDLQQHTFGDVISHCKLRDNFAQCDAYDSFNSISSKLKGKIKYILVSKKGNIQGVIAKSHRRY